MILQQLRKDSATILGDNGLPPPMYNPKPVRWVISLQPDGSHVFVKTEGEGKKGERGKIRLVPDVKVAGVVLRPKLLADTPAYTLGLTDDHRADAKFTAYKQLIADCADKTGEPSVRAVRSFLESYSPEIVPPPEEMTGSDLITFRVGGVFPIEIPAVQAYWALNARDAKEDASTGQCLICGIPDVEIVDRQPTKIKGVLGGQPGGTDLVSINSNAFESYGLKAAYASPTCRDCGESYAKALNSLISGERSHLYIGPNVFTFWTSDSGFDLLTFFDKPTAESVQDLLSSLHRGVRHSELNPADFYATSLTANSARAVVRDWLHTTVGNAQDQLAKWFARLEIVDPYGQPGMPLGIYRLAASLYRDANKEMIAQVPRLLMRSALHGDPLPDSLLAQAVKRNRAEQEVTYPRAALIKAVLLSSMKDPQESTRMSKLDPQHPKPAYHCGRLLAELEALQQQAIQGINTTLVDRFYGTASTAPASVFGNLLKGAQPHLSVLRRTREGAYHGIQQRLEEILGAIGEFPRTLALRDQADFSLGYYHQRAHDRSARSDAKRAREAQTTTPTSADIEEEEIR